MHPKYQIDFNKGRAVQVPSVAADAIAFSKEKNAILLITRKFEPYIGMFALPGGFVNYNEDPADACTRELEEETGLKTVSVPKLSSVAGEAGVDPRKHVISIVYSLDILPEEADLIKADDDAASVQWVNIDEIKKDEFQMAFKHKDCIQVFLNKQ